MQLSQFLKKKQSSGKVYLKILEKKAQIVTDNIKKLLKTYLFNLAFN